MFDEIDEATPIDPGDLESEASKQASKQAGAVDFADAELDSLSTAEQFDKLKKDAFTFITQDLSHKQLIVLGEGHNNDFTPLRLLIARMLPVMKDKGFDTLALEFDEAKYQPLVDKYMESGNPHDLKMPLASSVDFEDFLAILSVSRTQGIKVECVDRTAFLRSGDHDDADYQSNRDLGMFYNLKSIGSKAIFLVGNDHLNTEPSNESGRGIVSRLGYLLRHKEPILSKGGLLIKTEWGVDHALIRGVVSGGIDDEFGSETIVKAGISISRPYVVEPRGKFAQRKQKPDYLLVLPKAPQDK